MAAADSTKGFPAHYLPNFPESTVKSDSLKHLVPSVSLFIASFYQISDDPTQNEAWVDRFVDDAQLAIGPNRAGDKKAIAKIRQGMWDKVAKRKHIIHKTLIGQFDDNTDPSVEVVDLAIIGSAEFDFRPEAVGDGPPSMTPPWSGHARLVRPVGSNGSGPDDTTGGWRFSYYYVYLG